MGGKTTKLFRNSTESSSNGQDDDIAQCNEPLNNHDSHQPEETTIKNPISPFVYFRRG